MELSASEWYLALQEEHDNLIDKYTDLPVDNSRPILRDAQIAKYQRLLLLLERKLDVAERVSQIVEVLPTGRIVIISPEFSVEFEW